MSVNMKKMRKGYEDHQRGGDMFQFDVGETLVYIHPPCRDGDEWEPTAGVNYVPVMVHYGVGGKSMAVSLDPEKNPILDHPFIKALLKKRKVRLTGKCPISAALATGKIPDDKADEMRGQTRFLWGITPLKHRGKPSEEWRSLNAKPAIAMVGKQVFDGIMEAFFDNGDISDPDAAILVRIVREGKGRNDTKYKVKTDPLTLKKPLKLPAKLRADILKALAEGGDCDLFRVVANMVKGPAEVSALLAGVPVDDNPEDFDDESEEDDEAELDESEEEEEEKPKPKPKGKPGPKPKPKPEPEEDDDDESEDDDDESEDDDDDDESEEESEDDDDESEEEEEPKPKAKGKPGPKPGPKPSKSKKPSDDDDDDDDLGLDELEKALEDLEEEEPKPKAKPKAKK